jgi:hypothetical protein
MPGERNELTFIFAPIVIAYFITVQRPKRGRKELVLIPEWHPLKELKLSESENLMALIHGSLLIKSLFSRTP